MCIRDSLQHGKRALRFRAAARLDRLARRVADLCRDGVRGRHVTHRHAQSLPARRAHLAAAAALRALRTLGALDFLRALNALDPVRPVVALEAHLVEILAIVMPELGVMVSVVLELGVMAVAVSYTHLRAHET